MLTGLLIPGTSSATAPQGDLDIYLGDPHEAPPRMAFAIRDGAFALPRAHLWVSVAAVQAQTLPGVGGSAITLVGEDTLGRTGTLSIGPTGDPARVTIEILTGEGVVPQAVVQVHRAVVARAIETLLAPDDSPTSERRNT